MKYLNALIIIIALMIALVSTSSAQTRGIERHRGARVRERVVVRQPVNYKEVIVSNKHYFFRNGIFYERRHIGFVAVVAPIGARIAVLPLGYKAVRIRRTKYFFFGGVYYKFLPQERVYCVVQRPI